MQLDTLSIVLRLFGVVVSFVSGLAALNFSVRKDRRLTPFGFMIVGAILLGAVLSAISIVVDQRIYAQSGATAEERFAELQNSANAVRYTTANGTASFTMSLDKNSPLLSRALPALKTALDYARVHCMQLGDVAPCKDYLIRDVAIEEIRFDENSRLYRQMIADPNLARITSKAGVIVRFYSKPLPQNASQDDDDAYLGALFLSPSLQKNSSLFEFDGNRLRWFTDLKLPPEAFVTAEISSLVDLENGSATARASALRADFCNHMDDNTCEGVLKSLLLSLHLEVASFEFPHGRSISFFGAQSRTGNFGIPFLYLEFPRSVTEFPKNP